ncbi:hypothetical protein GCM10010168_25780 [Actinoplanes ianthinogenes]|uniref:Uncharacterized protein n=1 Tax=Actinoplanes ianthinogenes TaxID=122358 RepID=A0ABN6CSI3_9ACTN|nr:baseplate J/gp47 family protein [Actinoplanes ianthinogenes]BCJ48218.1 hypothetical protein Aiant_88750 [Actinoplanes ianthinogenes]GGR07211.1 hypothetical protein GCM10010168_25780 [Actinoplanes ianthinogenes]
MTTSVPELPAWLDRVVSPIRDTVLGLVSFAAEALQDHTPHGVLRHPPAAASVDLRFTRSDANDEQIFIPAGTRVAAPGPVVFVTAWSATIEPGQTAVTVRARHSEQVEGELVGVATGRPGQVLRVARAPIVALDDGHDVVLGVARPDPVAPARSFHGVTYEVWEPVSTFAGATAADRVYLLDRASGTVSFAPRLDLRDTAGAQPRVVGALPPAGAEIRMWYSTGGGVAGNVAANTVSAMRDPIPGVRVTNPAPARGGLALEDVTGMLARWRYEQSQWRRAITARDFEILAVSPAVARAGAAIGEGRVRVRLVPRVEAQARPGWRLTAEVLTEHQDAEVLAATQALLDERRPLTTTVVTEWARYKPVSVRGRVIVPAHEDPDLVRAYLEERLYQVISPAPAAGRNDGLPFGEPLGATVVNRVIEECAPEKSRVENLRLVVQDAPDTRTRAVEVDPARPDVWYAGSDDALFRSTNGGAGWEAVARFPDVVVSRLALRTGLLAVVAGNRVHLSKDSGDSWTVLGELEPSVTGAAWVDRDGMPALLLATDAGLYELSTAPGSAPLQVMVDDADPDRGLAAVTSFVTADGVAGVALAAQARRGVYLSSAGGRPNTFTMIGLVDTDVRTLAVRQDGTATVLWAGAGEADPRKPGKGCLRARLLDGDVHWETLSSDWTGGTCWDLAFTGSTVLAASQSGGVQRLDLGKAGPFWESAPVSSGLPLRDRTRFDAVETIAVTAGGRPVIGTSKGVYLETATDQWAAVAHREGPVTIPQGWLPCSAEHEIEVVRDTV